MGTLYVPLIIRLEIAENAPIVSFHEYSLTEVRSPTAGERTRQRLRSSGMKKRSPKNTLMTSESEFLPPVDEKHHTVEQKPANHPGRRTYSEVVVETLEGDRILGPESEPSSSTSNNTPPRSIKSASEPRDIEQASYYYGNPLLEKTEGIMHFYKYNDEKLAQTAQCRMLCMMAVPAQLTVAEIINFIGGAISSIERVKVVRDSTPNQYMLILKFKSHNDTVMFYEEFANKPFNSLEPHRCFLLFVDRIECASSEDMSELCASTALTELPTCSVCLERMDDSVLAILCNHTFHANCLVQWSDNTCPVCRYIQSPELVAEQRCSDCGQSNDLWICLICGNIGCGRYALQHAQRHWELTSHTFSLKVGGEIVWDYAGDNYVHRLIESDTDGKLVEYQRENNLSTSDDKDDKLEGIKLEYTLLLTNQLEDQRKYFEGRLADVEKAMNKMEKMAYAQVESLESQLEGQGQEMKTLKVELQEAVTARTSSDKKLAQLNEKLGKAKSELKDEQDMNKMLRQDQQVWKTQFEDLQKKQAVKEKEYTEKMEDLQAQVNDLLLHFETQSKIANQLATGNVTQQEVESGQLGVTPAANKTPQRRRSNRKS
ncbi:unnamed protein product [Caenorhabditis auriculariae]|uniref:BRCA1-associated protein n=1 Tax=Caenorhabditis auriculariae TaxID=2777116 RepID=A0A8S1HIZ8_9PELO|nr:unnamed protein product [Caenorhabditis auriculariae]